MLKTAEKWRAARLGRLAWGVVRIAPMQAALFVLLHLLAQASLLVALVLPWKLIAHAGDAAGGTLLMQPWPDHPLQWHEVAMLVVASLAIYTCAELSMGVVRRQGERRVHSSLDRFPIFDGNQKQFQLNFRRILYSLSRAFAVVMVALALGWIYPALLVACVPYFVVGLLGVWILSRDYWISDKIRGLGETGALRNSWVGGGLLYAGVVAYLDFERGEMPVLSLALLGLLLLRLALASAAQLVVVLRALVDRIDRLEAFFSGGGRASDGEGKAMALLSLAKPERRLAWVREALQGCADPRAEVSVSDCWIFRGGWALCTTVRCTVAGQPDRVYLIKVFDACAQERVFNEICLVLDAPASWPVPRLLQRCVAHGHSGLIYEWSDRAGPVAKAERPACLSAVRERLLSCRLAAASQARYARSRSQLPERLRAIDWYEVAALLSGAGGDAAASLRAGWEQVIALARALPGQLVIPHLQFMRLDRVDDRVVLSNLSKWCWEPVGSGWPVALDSQAWEGVLARACTERSELARVSVAQARLMAFCHEFERLWRGRDFDGAVDLVVPMADAFRCVLAQGEQSAFNLVSQE